MFLRTIKRRLHRPKVREIPLEQLAALWVERDETDQERELKLSDKWLHDEINGFYSQYVNTSLPPSDPARPVIEEILTLLDEQGYCPSAPGTIPEEEIYAEISLREYSLEVARIAYEMVLKGHKDPELLLGKIFIITLGHQLGVLSSEQMLGGVPAKSLLILEPHIRDLAYRDAIVEAIRTFTGNHPKSQEARILKAASSAARKREYERARVFSKVWHQAPVDIEDIKKAIKEEK